LVGPGGRHDDATLGQYFCRRLVVKQLLKRLFHRAVAVVGPIGVHHEWQVFGIFADDEVRAQVNLGHGPPLGAIGGESGEFAHGGHARGGVGHDAPEPQEPLRSAYGRRPQRRA
jgi:hypothetical protein